MEKILVLKKKRKYMDFTVLAFDNILMFPFQHFDTKKDLYLTKLTKEFYVISKKFCLEVLQHEHLVSIIFIYTSFFWPEYWFNYAKLREGKLHIENFWPFCTFYEPIRHSRFFPLLWNARGGIRWPLLVTRNGSQSHPNLLKCICKMYSCIYITYMKKLPEWTESKCSYIKEPSWFSSSFNFYIQ